MATHVLIVFTNALQIQSNMTLPPNVHDAKLGIVSLKPGEYVIFTAQFRVGDGETISKDWEALRYLQGFSLAWSIWQTTDPHVLDNMLAQYHAKDGHIPGGLRMSFDHSAMRRYYDDFVERGEDAHIRSHFGAERATMVESSHTMMGVMGNHMLDVLEESGEIEVMYAHMRQMGLDDLADEIKLSRQTT